MSRKRDELEDAGGISAARRQFLRKTGRAGLLALGAPALAANWTAEAYGATSRSYLAGRYALDLDNAPAGFLAGFSGGNVTGDVVTEKPDQNLVQHKHIGGVRVEPITIETGLPMPDTGLEVTPGWWRKSMEAFREQVEIHCHNCGIPLRRDGQLAMNGDREEFSRTHLHIAHPKTRGRPVAIVESIGTIERSERPATNYLPHTTPGY